MKGKKFEDICIKRMQEEESLNRATMCRCGVQATFVDGKWQPIFSLPDFSGLLFPRGREFTFDAKVCGTASFPLNDDKFKRRQFKHLVTRDRFGAISFLLIHFTARQLKKTSYAAETWAFPVSLRHPFWQAFDRGEVKSISREDCREYGALVEWNILKAKGRTERPDIVMAIYELAAKLNKGGEVEDAE